MAYQSVNPNDGQVLASFEHLSAAQLERTLAQAQAAFAPWRDRAFADRAAVLRQAARLMNARVDDLARLATLEMGKRLDEARAEVRYSADILGYCAQHAETLLAPTKLHPRVGDAHLEHVPLGPLYCVEPWNFPYYQLARVAGAQLMAGNVMVVKHAANVPQCALAFEALLGEAGAPPGVYANLFISHAQSDQVIDDPRIRGVALTGGVGAGRQIAARAGQALKKSTMELGRSDSFIVLDDADLDHVLPWAVWGRLYNAGQTCCAAKRFIVLDALADPFIARFTAALAALQPGNPMDTATTLGPMASEAGLRQLLVQVDAAVQAGARVLLGGRRLDRPGAFMQPTVLVDIDPANPAYREEFFGPVASVHRVADEAAAVRLANDSDFGLGASVWTRDAARGRRVASQVDAGMVFFNNLDWADADLPFGGVKHSGYGRELGRACLHAFVNAKLVRGGDLAAPA